MIPTDGLKAPENLVQVFTAIIRNQCTTYNKILKVEAKINAIEERLVNRMDKIEELEPRIIYLEGLENIRAKYTEQPK